MNIIFHITKQENWDKAKLEAVYSGDTLDSQGFIHCSTFHQIVKVANTLYPAQKELVLFCIDTKRVHSEIKYESNGSEEFFPHIYGPLNIDAIVKVVDFEPTNNGKFIIPKEMSK